MSLNSFQKIIQCVSVLYKKFYQVFHIDRPHTKASALHYFYQFYQKQNLQYKEYAITAISAFCLSSKVNYTPLSLNRVYNEIITPNQKVSNLFKNEFSLLDGISDLSIDKLNQREMDIIIFLNFNFSTGIPYEISIKYIEKILNWHISPKSQDYDQIKTEIIHKCWTFFNDLQTQMLFYQNPPEVLAISCIELTFRLLDLPLVTPNGPWYLFIYPNADSLKISEVTSQIYKLFYVLFHGLKNQIPINLPPNFDKNLFLKWISVPIIPMKNVPLVPPPKLELLKSMINHNPCLDVCGCDFSPQFPPPDISD